MVQPEERPRFPKAPVLLALALAGSNWLVRGLSFGPGQISGNGFYPPQFLMTLLSIGLAVGLLATTFGYADRLGQRMAPRGRWVAGLVLFAAGAG